jgi:hypothetical protein
MGVGVLSFDPPPEKIHFLDPPPPPKFFVFANPPDFHKPSVKFHVISPKFSLDPSPPPPPRFFAGLMYVCKPCLQCYNEEHFALLRSFSFELDFHNFFNLSFSDSS